MSFSTVLSAAVFGLKVEFVQVEADVSNGLPTFQMVGYLSSEVKEAAERVRTAIRNSELNFPAKRIVVNLSPATIRKSGSAFDLPIAVALLCSLGEIKIDRVEKTLIIGELGLNGTVQKVPGILPIVMEAKEKGISCCILPSGNLKEGCLINGIKIIGVHTLKEVCDYLNERIMPEQTMNESNWEIKTKHTKQYDYSDIQGQESVKRAIEVAVAGSHNLLMIGPPGSGKTMAAKRIPSIFPPMTIEESMEITKIYSILGMVDEDNPLVQSRPFRSVHHTTTKAALIGGGLRPRPGEISLAHGGVLFLDELPEFPKNVLEVLRQPLEERQIRLTRSYGNYVYPANFMLIAAMNPCPCGGYPDLGKCVCTPYQVQNYLSKLSQPFLDRLDLCIEVNKVEYDVVKMRKCKESESSEQIRKRVCAARAIQNERYQGTLIQSNAMLPANQIEKYCKLGEAEERIMEKAFCSLELTARSYHKIIRVARTIADLDQSDDIKVKHLTEAVGYRIIDKRYWGHENDI